MADEKMSCFYVMENEQPTVIYATGLKISIEQSQSPCEYDINSLKPTGNYMYHLLHQSVMLCFVFVGFV
jgi:hypothetical protein